MLVEALEAEVADHGERQRFTSEILPPVLLRGVLRDRATRRAFFQQIAERGGDLGSTTRELVRLLDAYGRGSSTRRSRMRPPATSSSPRTTPRAHRVEIGAAKGVFPERIRARSHSVRVLDLDDAPSAVRVDSTEIDDWTHDEPSRTLRFATPTASTDAPLRTEVDR